MRQNYGAAFVTKIDAAGTSILYSTFLNLEGNPESRPFADGVLVDQQGRAFVSGSLSRVDAPSANDGRYGNVIRVLNKPVTAEAPDRQFFRGAGLISG